MANKDQIRRRLRDQRRSLAREIVESAGRRVADRLNRAGVFGDATSVLAYAATENEVPADVVIAGVRRRGLEVGLPRVSGDRIEFCRVGASGDLRPDRWGIPAPVDCRELAIQPTAVALVPLVGWDAGGRRLGRGGGYYDRAMSEWPPSVLRIGLAYEFQRLDEVPADPWDVPLHAIATERRIVWCDRGSLAAVRTKEEADGDGIRFDSHPIDRSRDRPRLGDRSRASQTIRRAGPGH